MPARERLASDTLHATKKRKPRRQYTVAAIERAVRLVQRENWTLARAAEVVGVPRSTIGDYLADAGRVMRALGRPPVVSPAMTHKLLEELDAYKKANSSSNSDGGGGGGGKALTLDQQVAFCNERLHEAGVQHTVTKAWLLRMRRKAPEEDVPVRRPTPPPARMWPEEPQTPHALWREDVHATMLACNMRSEHVFSVDQMTLFGASSAKDTPTWARGAEVVAKRVGESQQPLLSMITCVSGEGVQVPPFFVVPVANAASRKDSPAAGVGARTADGLVSADAFVSWFVDSFVSHVRNALAMPATQHIMLLVDRIHGHGETLLAERAAGHSVHLRPACICPVGKFSTLCEDLFDRFHATWMANMAPPQRGTGGRRRAAAHDVQAVIASAQRCLREAWPSRAVRLEHVRLGTWPVWWGKGPHDE